MSVADLDCVLNLKLSKGVKLDTVILFTIRSGADVSIETLIEPMQVQQFDTQYNSLCKMISVIMLVIPTNITTTSIMNTLSSLEFCHG